MEKKLFLLDAYALIFRAYYAFIKNPRINSDGLNTSAMFGFTNTLMDLIASEKPTHIAVVFDYPAPNFRNEIYPEYKANRPPTPEDIKLSVPYIKKILNAFQIPIIEAQGYEADDVIGTLAKQAEKKDFKVFMMTPDKDFAQLVSERIFMYKPRRSGNEAEILGVNEVRDVFNIERPEQVIDILGLAGDSADNIPGAPGIGPKTAQKLIAQYGDIEGLIKNIADLKGKQKENIEENIEQIRLSRVLATIDVNVPVEINEEDLKSEPVDFEMIRPLFQELDFRNLLERVKQFAGAVSGAKDVDQPIQGSLFGDASGGVIIPSNLKTIDSVHHDYFLLDSDEKIEDLIEKIEQVGEFCFDTETTSVNANEAELVGIAFSYKTHEAFYLPVSKDEEQVREQLNKFRSVFENEKIRKIGQNLKYDIIVLKWYDIEVKGDVFDTMIAHYLINPEQKHNMDYLAETYLEYSPVSITSLIGKKGKNQGSMRNVPVERVKDYAAEDADITIQLKEVLEKELIEKDLIKLYNEIEKDLIYVLAEMEKTGVKLNISELDAFAEKLRIDILDLEKDIFKLAGVEFNISSPKQLGDILFEKMKIVTDAKKTKTKQYSTSEDVLVKLKDKHEIIEKILDFRSLKKLLSTYVEALPKLVNSKTGKIHTSFNQARVATGRLSSDNPNLQNIPIREERGRGIRKSFIPSADELIFVSADYSQVELRLMAHLSQDMGMIEAFANGEDIHIATAAKINKISLSEVTKDMRSRAKSANFGIIYGISAFGLANNLNIPRTEAKQLIDSYFESYPKVKEYMDLSIKTARDAGYVETIFGRRRLLNDINSRNPMIRGIAERNAINAPIQGSAADIIKLAMINIFKKFQVNNFNSKMLMQVHDELNFEVYLNELEDVKKIIVEEMQNAVQLSVPLTVDLGTGYNWLEAH